MHLDWHGGLSVTFWLPFSELDAHPRVMRIDMGIHEPMNAYYSGVDLIDALLDLKLPGNSGTKWENGPRWQNPDYAFDMPENVMEENLAADGPGQEEANVRQGEVAAEVKDDDSGPFPLRVMLAPDFEPPTRGGGVQVRVSLDVNSGTVSGTSRETTVVGSSGEGSTPETRVKSWRKFDTLRIFIGVEGHAGCVRGPVHLDLSEVGLPNVGNCEWKTGVTTRQFVLESEQRIAASGDDSMLKRLATVLGDGTWRKSKEEHTPFSPRPWTTSLRSAYNVAKQIVELSVKGESGPTALSTLLRDDWPKPNPRGLRRDQYADIFKAYLWDGPAMPDGPWCLAIPVESHTQQKRFRVYSQHGIPSPEVAYQFFVRQGQDVRTGTLLPLGHVSKDDPSKRVVQRAPLSLSSTLVDLICVGELPETWNSWTFVPDRDRSRDGLLIPTYNSPKEKQLLIPKNPLAWKMGPGRCFFYHGIKNKHPQWNRPYRYRLSDHLRYTTNDPRRKLPLPPDHFFFVEDTLLPPVLGEGCFKPSVPLEHGIPRTDIVYYYHSNHQSRPHMGMFVPADHNDLAQRRPLNYYYPPLLYPIQEIPPASSLERYSTTAHKALLRSSRAGSESAGESSRGVSERVIEVEERETSTASVQEQALTEPVQEQVPTEPVQEHVPTEPVQEPAATEPVQEEALKNIWVTAEEYLGDQTEGTDEMDGTNETNETNETDE